jgi:hypothetical protein
MMHTRSPSILGTTADSLAPPVAVQITAALAAMALLAGIAAAIIGNMAGYRAIYYVAVLVLYSIVGLVTLTRREPLRFAFLASIVCYPVAAAAIPPERLGLAVFHAEIRPGSFRPYLIETQPTVVDHYGFGAVRGTTYIPDQPESGYLKIFYEGGILGSIAAIPVAGDALRRAMDLIVSKNANSIPRTEAIAALAGLITFGITFVTLYTLSDPRGAAVFSFLLAVILHRSLQLARAASQAS